jgi:hypothetical protein
MNQGSLVTGRSRGIPGSEPGPDLRRIAFPVQIDRIPYKRSIRRTELRHMLIGDSVIYDGRPHVVVGFTPTSVIPAQIELRDPSSGATFWVDRDNVSDPDALERAALRLLPPES